MGDGGWRPCYLELQELIKALNQDNVDRLNVYITVPPS